MEIKETQNGRGIFATKPYSVGDIIEVSQVILLGRNDTKKIDGTVLYNYYFSWGNKNDQAAIALGNGSLFNHSYEPNAKYIKNQTNKTIQFVAIKPIKKEEEIVVNYNGDPNSKKPLWFDVDPTI